MRLEHYSSQVHKQRSKEWSVFSFIREYYSCALHSLRIYCVPDMILATRDSQAL